MELISKNKKILIFSDTHQDVDKAEKIIKEESADINIHVGDFFDSMFHNNQGFIQKTCKFIEKYSKLENHYFLFGNHDLPYLYENQFTICSGFEIVKKTYINNSLDVKKIREKFLWYIWIDDFLVSHAGLHPYFLPEKMEINKVNIDKFLKEEQAECNHKLLNGFPHWFFLAGKARDGKQKFGGLTWLDFDDEFKIIEGIPQIVGHTFHSRIGCNRGNFCIDTNLNYYLTITNGKFEVKNFIDI